MTEAVNVGDQQLFTRGYILNLLSQSLLNVSKDLYNLEFDDLSSLTLHMSSILADRVDDSRKDELVHPRESVTSTPLTPVAKCGCKEQTNCVGHTNASDACEIQDNPVSMESEVTDIVSKIRQEQTRG